MNISSLQKGLVGHWKLSEASFNPATKRFSDSTPHGNHGTGIGTQLGSAAPGFQADRMGQAGMAAPFNGIDDYIDCGNDASLNVGDETTISLWIKETTRTAGGKVVIKRTGSALTFLTLGSYNGIPRIHVGNGVINQFVGADSAISLNEWHHIVGIFTDSTNTGIISVDGVVKSGTISLSCGDLAGVHTIIGKHHSGTFYGSIYDIRIYNRALSQPEITLLNESYRPGVLI